MVRIPETARALDQICRGMKDKPGGGESSDIGSCVYNSKQPRSLTHAASQIGSSILGSLSPLWHPAFWVSLSLSFWDSLLSVPLSPSLCLSLLSLSISFFLQTLLTPNSFSPITWSVTLDQSL